MTYRLLALLTALVLSLTPGPPAPGAAARQPAAGTRHPLDPLTGAEIGAAARLLRADRRFPPGGMFSELSLQEPPKEAVWLYRPGTPFGREAFALVYDRASGRTIQAVADLSAGRIREWREPLGVQPALLSVEYTDAIQAVRSDPRWQDAIRRRGIRDFENVQVDAWAPGLRQGTDRARIIRALSYYRGRSGNAYARPIEGVLAVVDVGRRQVLDVTDTGLVPLAPQDAEYDERAGGPLRRAPRPLQITQPLGASYQVAGHEVRWQKWRFRWALHPREGLVLNTVAYEDGGRVRPVLYRASLCEMAVPYGDPDATWHFRHPVDVGEYGIGRLASPLAAGQDAPENAQLLNATLASESGQPYEQPRAVALYERDGGILWRHQSLAGVVESRRARELVLGFVTTVGNYDYGLNWVFGQDGGLKVEALLTGIMLPKGVRAKTAGDRGPGGDERYGHLVAPNVVAANHQHFLCFRLDLDIDGARPNVAFELNAEPDPAGPENPGQNAFLMTETLLVSERAARREVNLATGRRWVIANPSALNPLGHPAGYLLQPGENALPLAGPGSAARRRAGFLDHHLWVTRHDPEERYAAGDFVNQSAGGEGLPKWTADDASLMNADIVVWYTMGVTHMPRAEEWPVMPVHPAGFRLLPAGFFTRNPALDVPRVR